MEEQAAVVVEVPSFIEEREINEVVELLLEIGRGSFGSVYKVCLLIIDFLLLFFKFEIKYNESL